jgi:hypothetical protein
MFYTHLQTKMRVHRRVLLPAAECFVIEGYLLTYITTYLLTYSVRVLRQKPAGQEIPRTLWNTMVHYSIHN